MNCAEQHSYAAEHLTTSAQKLTHAQKSSTVPMSIITTLMKHNSNPKTLIDKRCMLSGIILLALPLHFSYLNCAFFILIKILNNFTTIK
jgi:hypothetical protein